MLLASLFLVAAFVSRDPIVSMRKHPAKRPLVVRVVSLQEVVDRASMEC